MNQLQSRARKKALQNENLVSLIELANERQDHYLKASQCCSAGEIKDGKVVMRYCRSRICRICNNIKTATLINKYQSQFDISRTHFVTLTFKNVEKEQLRQSLKDQKRILYNTRQALRRKGINLSGIYTTEITYNEKSKEYHPHIHMMVQGSFSDCEELVCCWVARSNKMGYNCSFLAQDIQKVSGPESFKELFKYVSKWYKDKDGKLDAVVVDTIIEATWGLRMVQTFGDIIAQSEEIQEESIIPINAIEGDMFLWASDDWYSITTGESLSKLLPAKKPRTPQFCTTIHLRGPS